MTNEVAGGDGPQQGWVAPASEGAAGHPPTPGFRPTPGYQPTPGAEAGGSGYGAGPSQGYGAGPGPTRFCFACGRNIDVRAEICPGCGVRQPWPSAVSPKPRRDRIVAALLAIFLGNFGVHKFYLGHIGVGIVYALFCWTSIPGVLGVIEGILYLMKSDEQWAIEYGDGVVASTSRGAAGCLIALAVGMVLFGILIFLIAIARSTSTLSTY